MTPRVLVKEKIGDSGVQLLRDAGFDVELGADWEDGELERRIYTLSLRRSSI